MQADRAAVLKDDGMKVNVHVKCPNYRDCCTAAHCPGERVECHMPFYQRFDVRVCTGGPYDA
jgi:hypothetical protein